MLICIIYFVFSINAYLLDWKEKGAGFFFFFSRGIYYGLFNLLVKIKEENFFLTNKIRLYYCWFLYTLSNAGYIGLESIRVDLYVVRLISSAVPQTHSLYYIQI